MRGRKVISIIVAAFTALAAIAGIGAALYVFGVTTLAALVYDSWLCCCGAVIALGGLILVILITRNVMSRKILNTLQTDIYKSIRLYYNPCNLNK